ncbi:hypothetical protein [Oceanicola sp. S124]|uniref:hypothetical protein n=1 Tax=Oceanicola sp. S124 TaxID=1042378 RepID=UPI0002559F11|nr:hypothetical protein [Oceanicola sp. S124]
MILLIPIGIAIFLVYMWIWGPSPVKGCRWRMDRSRDQKGQSFFHCPLCGAETLTVDGKPPRHCGARKTPSMAPDSEK